MLRSSAQQLLGGRRPRAAIRPDSAAIGLTLMFKLHIHRARRKETGRAALWSCVAACGLSLGLFLPGSAAQAQGVVKSKHGDWELRCETPPGASREQCALLQSIAAEDKPNVNLVVIVLKTADGKSRLLRVIAPLGVLLPNGLGLKIDQTDVGRAGFVRCLPTGCVAEVIMEDKLIDQMKGGQTATFIIYQTPEEGIGIPLNLAGFKDGYEKLP